MNSDGYNEALYPIGVSSRRYVVNYGARHDLVFQQMLHGAPKTIWRLSLKEKDPHPRKRRLDGSGTLRQFLAGVGFEIETRHLTRAQTAALGAQVNFVGYSLMAETYNLNVAFVAKDGTKRNTMYNPNPMQFKPPFFPIPAEESRLLGLGSAEWHGTGHFEIRKQGSADSEP
jgi:hypothetical protein